MGGKPPSSISRFIVVFGEKNKVFASGQAIRAASYAVLRPTVHGSERAGRKNILYADSPQAAGYRTREVNQSRLTFDTPSYTLSSCPVFGEHRNAEVSR